MSADPAPRTPGPLLGRDVEALRRVGLFTGLSTARLKLIAYVTEVLDVAPDDVIVSQGEPADGVSVVLAGEAELSVIGSDGQSRRLWTIGPQSLVGDTAVLCQGPSSATVRARGPVRILRIPARRFLDLVRQSPEVGVQVLVSLARRLVESTTLLQQRTRL